MGNDNEGGMVLMAKRDKSFDDGFSEGWDQCESEMKDISPIDLARIAFLLSGDATINHTDAGSLIYRISNKVKQEEFQK